MSCSFIRFSPCVIRAAYRVLREVMLPAGMPRISKKYPFQENTVIFRTDVEQCTNFERLLADSKGKHAFLAKKSYTAGSLCGKRDVFQEIALLRAEFTQLTSHYHKQGELVVYLGFTGATITLQSLKRCNQAASFTASVCPETYYRKRALP